MTLVFIRHGQSESNAAGVIGGWRDYPLTDVGRDQARRAAERLAGSPVDAIYASDLSRAAETARIIAAGLDLEVTEDRTLRERSWGDAEGLTRPEIVERFGDVSRGQGFIPNEEAVDDFLGRLVPLFERLHERHREGRALVVSHAGVTIGVMSHLFGVPPAELPRFNFVNTSFTVVEGTDPPSLGAINDHAHLE